MIDRAFIDTNVLVYLFDKRDTAKTAAAHSLVGRDDLTFCVSSQALSEFYVTATRKVGVPPGVAAAAVELYRRLDVVPVDSDLVAEAIELAIKPMRLPGGDGLDRDWFEEILDMARSGVRISDMPTTERMDTALDAVAAAAPNPPQASIDAARRAFAEG